MIEKLRYLISLRRSAAPLAKEPLFLLLLLQTLLLLLLLLHLGSAVALGVHLSVHCVSFE